MYKNIVLEKSMYNQNKTFTEVLEKADPSQNYKCTSIEKLDAFERQLKRFDIKIKGGTSDTVSKFFETSQSAMLFPEFVSRCVVQGVNDITILNDIIATKTKINALDYRPISCVADDKVLSLKKIAEGASIPKTEINIQSNLVKLCKRGRMLVSSYEAIKFQRLDIFAITLKQIGAYIARSQLKDAVDVLINGDGNFNEATAYNTAAKGTITYDDLITLWSKFEDFQMNRLLVAPDVMTKLMGISEFKDPACGV